MDRAPKRVPKSDKSAWRYPALLIALVVLGLLVMDFNNRMSELNRLTAQREVVRARATMHVQTKTALEAQIAHATSEAAVLEWAYGQAHMVRPGDQPVVPISVGTLAPTPVPTQVYTATTPSNLETWVSLFTGPVSPFP